MILDEKEGNFIRIPKDTMVSICHDSKLLLTLIYVLIDCNRLGQIYTTYNIIMQFMQMNAASSTSVTRNKEAIRNALTKLESMNLISIDQETSVASNVNFTIYVNEDYIIESMKGSGFIRLYAEDFNKLAEISKNENISLARLVCLYLFIIANTYSRNSESDKRAEIYRYSFESIAERSGIGKRTVAKYFKLLCEYDLIAYTSFKAVYGTSGWFRPVSILTIQSSRAENELKRGMYEIISYYNNQSGTYSSNTSKSENSSYSGFSEIAEMFKDMDYDVY